MTSDKKAFNLAVPQGCKMPFLRRKELHRFAQAGAGQEFPQLFEKSAC